MCALKFQSPARFFRAQLQSGKQEDQNCLSISNIKFWATPSEKKTTDTFTFYEDSRYHTFTAEFRFSRQSKISQAKDGNEGDFFNDKKVENKTSRFQPDSYFVYYYMSFLHSNIRNICDWPHTANTYNYIYLCTNQLSSILQCGPISS